MSELSEQNINESNDDTIEDVSEECDQNSGKCDDKSDISVRKKRKTLKTSASKTCKRGVVYLSFIPPGLNVNRIRQLMSELGEVDRIYLQKEKSSSTEARDGRRKASKKSYNCRYVEGWLEFKKKSVAKMAANVLNGKQIGGKRKNKFYDQIWSLKYLPKFKWSHLAEQLTYEKALRQQKLRLEINRAKTETDFYRQMSHKNKMNKRHKTSDQNESESNDRRSYKQRITDEVIRKSKTTDNDIDYELLNKIFK